MSINERLKAGDRGLALGAGLFVPTQNRQNPAQVPQALRQQCAFAIGWIGLGVDLGGELLVELTGLR